MPPGPRQSAHQNAARVSRGSPISRLKESALRGELVAVVGSGVSIGLTNNRIPALSWKGLIVDGFAHGVKKGTISAAQAKGWRRQLDSSDLDELLGAAEFMGRKLGAPNGHLYARWLENIFKDVMPANKKLEDGLRALHRAGVPLCTLNYDPLLERVTGLATVNLVETAKAAAWMRDKGGVLHLHGSWDAPATCILGIRDYETTLRNDIRDLIQRSLSSFKRLLFLGCGDTFADPNFSALIRWLREKMMTAAPEHYAAVSDGEVAARQSDPAWSGFVEPLGYGKSHDQLAGFLIKHFAPLTARAEKSKAALAKGATRALNHARLLQNYRAFLLKDCGQMTIEGVRADMDTAQRRFDLERLFVPLQVLPSPPEIAENDPEREQKLLHWKERNKDPLPFGDVLTRHKRLALLALPGGGKSLLLKRLAVAYADPARRLASSDALPDLDLTPVLIRCREWREHIHRPIPTLLKSISDITGDASLAGLSDALIPLFKKGRILLLVDGLDEIHDGALRTTFVDHLEAFLDDYRLTRAVITSREAGFALVAPSLARFCGRWRLAPLNEEAIVSLCEHWHRLMIGDSPQAEAEGRQVADLLLRKESLKRLAENPLLLTMLLVVKHGAGRLPPDRVSLYSRAVEVLLDTWNIKGHDPLNLKEAVPQLACVAFELMRSGKQTATENELLRLLEEARERVPQIRRYAKDTPQEFLKRVELRSSLLVEAGHQTEGKNTVPFYQFRHLTFQEYLAAVAAVEGHYAEYDKSDTLLTPLHPYLHSEEWKEVIPMSAVLARKQAEPLIRALVEEAKQLRVKVQANESFAGKDEWLGYAAKLPAPVARLVQSFVEEAEAAPETLAAALQLIAFFARGCRSDHSWQALIRGPYGEELFHQGWLLYNPMLWPKETGLRNTCAEFAAHRQPDSYWESSEGQAELSRMLGSDVRKEIGRGLLACAGTPRNYASRTAASILPLVERHLFSTDPALYNPALWAWALIQNNEALPIQRSPAVLDRLVSMCLNDSVIKPESTLGFALQTQLGLPRAAWTPALAENDLQRAMHRVQESYPVYSLAVSCLLAFHSGSIWPEEELASQIFELLTSRAQYGVLTSRRARIWSMLQQMGETGKKYLQKLAQDK